MELILVFLLSSLALGAVLYPVIRGTPAGRRLLGAADGRGTRGTPRQDPLTLLDDAALEAEVARYREAIRAGSLCQRCSQANPRDSRFCAECGGRLR